MCFAAYKVATPVAQSLVAADEQLDGRGRQRFHRRAKRILECWWRAIHETQRSDPVAQRSDPVEDLEDVVGFLTSFLIRRRSASGRLHTSVH